MCFWSPNRGSHKLSSLTTIFPHYRCTKLYWKRTPPSLHGPLTTAAAGLFQPLQANDSSRWDRWIIVEQLIAKIIAFLFFYCPKALTKKKRCLSCITDTELRASGGAGGGGLWSSLWKKNWKRTRFLSISGGTKVWAEWRLPAAAQTQAERPERTAASLITWYNWHITVSIVTQSVTLQ